MKKQSEPMFVFKQEGDVWKSSINPGFLVYFQTTLGVPYDMVIDWIGDLTKKQRLFIKLDCWIKFCKDNNIELDEIRKTNGEHKEEMIALLDSIIDER